MPSTNYKMKHIEYYISTGRKGAQYTLRSDEDGFDLHHCNLGIQWEQAISKAIQIMESDRKALKDYKITLRDQKQFDLVPYGHLSDDEKQAIQEREERKIKFQEEQAEREKLWKEEEAKRELLKASKKFVGNIKERIEMTVTTKAIIFLGEGVFGAKYLTIMDGDDGNSYVHFGNSHSLPCKGESSKIKFTIKEHKEYEGEKQNVIARPVTVDN